MASDSYEPGFNWYRFVSQPPPCAPPFPASCTHAPPSNAVHALVSLGYRCTMRGWIALVLICSGCATAPQPTLVAPGASDGSDAAPLPSSARTNQTPPPEWVGTWRGEFGGTQEFAALELKEDGRFEYQIDSGPDSTCCVEGTWAVNRDTLSFTASDAGCEGAPLASYTHIYRRGAHGFALADPSLSEHIQTNPDGTLSGPVWTFERDGAAKPSCH